MASTPNNSSLLSDQDNNQFLVYAVIEPLVFYMCLFYFPAPLFSVVSDIKHVNGQEHYIHAWSGIVLSFEKSIMQLEAEYLTT